MKNTLYIIFFLGLIITAIGLGYRGEHIKAGDFNSIITLIGLTIIAPFLIYFGYSRLKKNKKVKKETADKNKKFQDFLYTSKKSILKLDSVEIISIDNKPADNFNTTIANIQENNTRKKAPKEVKINLKYKGKKMHYSFLTTKNLYDLKIHLALKKETYIYDNRGDIYIDFSFLS